LDIIEFDKHDSFCNMKFGQHQQLLVAKFLILHLLQ